MQNEKTMGYFYIVVVKNSTGLVKPCKIVKKKVQVVSFNKCFEKNAKPNILNK